MINIRTLIFTALVFISSILILSFNTISFNFLGLDIDRGDSESILGLSLGLDLKGGTHLVYEAVPNKDREITSEDMEGARKILERRVNSFGISESSVQIVGSGSGVSKKLLVQLPGLSDLNLNLTIAGGISSEELKNSLNENGFNDIKVTELETLDGKFLLSGPKLKNDDNGGLTNLLSSLDKKYPYSFLIAYSSQSEDGEQLEVPELSKVIEAANKIDSDNTVEDLSQGIFRITVKNFLPVIQEKNDRFYDQQKVQQFIEPFDEIGVVFQASIAGGITSWKVSGGVEEAKKLIGETAQLEFKERDCLPVENENNEDIWPPDNLSIEEWVQARCIIPNYYEDKAVALSGEDLVDAFPDVQPGIARPVVTIIFDDDGSDEFYDLTSRVAKNQDLLAIFLDGEQLIAPSASSGISGGRAFIQGPTFDQQSVKTISIQLKSGALPVGLNLIQERNVDASLGSDSLSKSLFAGSLGLILVLIFMISYYRVPGLVASLSLLFYSTLLLAVFKIVPITLTLSGAAAVILSIGVAVDANILISERTKEELRSGRNIFASISEGFSRAWPSIRDSNVSTIIICVVLYWFGDRFTTSVIQGFALTLGVGVLLSMFTAFTVSRLLMRLISSTPIGKKDNLYDPLGSSKVGNND
ncbi:MAG: protein translocase subunit SecD [Chloroflexi bacterium]|nr:protein translocase subunit SecD [Chloroflexota bacterium]|tara:strand:- start:9794 stop:11722 length:1929 start_codon:yes stop_codon:yes gene_type:complete